MYGVQKNILKKLSSKQYIALKEMCRISKNIYNVALYEVRQHFLAEKQYLKYATNYHKVKLNENYRILHSGIAQQTMKVVDRSFKSFFELIKLAKKGQYDFNKIRMPKYLPKDSYFALIIPQVSFKEDSRFDIPMSPSFKNQFGKVTLTLPECLRDKTIKEVRIHPKYQARFFEIEYVYEISEENPQLDSDKAIAIDLGVDNLAACITTDGVPLIISGKFLKSINQWYNKQNAFLQGFKDKLGIKGITNRQARLCLKRNNQVRDYLNKTARYVVNYCRTSQIAKVIVGCNLEQKQEINIGSRNNQNFVQIPHHSLRQKLKALCERYGLTYIEQEESYTSKASFIDGDEIPIYKKDTTNKYKFSGRRVKRGLYKTQSGNLISADINGAANILKKSNHKTNFSGVASGILGMPLRSLDLVRIPK